MSGEIHFAPLLAAPWLWLGLGVALLAGLAALVLRPGAAGLRLAAAALVALALAGPMLEQPETAPLPSILVMVSDESGSAQLGDRASQIAAARADITAEFAARGDIELRDIRLTEDPESQSTLLGPSLAEALAQIPPERLAGVVALTDGQIRDADRLPPLDQPLHVLQAGASSEWDQRLVIEAVPAYGIIGEPVVMRLSVLREGAVPARLADQPAILDIELDNATTRRVQIPAGETVELTLTPRHAGSNLIRLSTPAQPGELTAANNATLVDVTGIRDRLRVLLVSGTPHAGERVWRNLLKSDSAVDLVHFTILRPLGKQDGVPVNELSLIAFPTQELFLDKIDEFDLIIFDRYRLQGILPPIYLANIVSYVETGGALLVAAGPEYASVESLYRSQLAAVLPASPTAQVMEQGFYPEISAAGARHPVTETLMADPEWGPWYRHIGVRPTRGDVLMEAEGAPLLVVDRAVRGRVALLASDQIWLWARGHEGGGPHRELMRRLAHWLMGEPDLDEEGLQATPRAGGLRIERRSMAEAVEPVTVITPSGDSLSIALDEVAPGRFTGSVPALEEGLYTLQQGDQSTVAGIGAPQPVELAQVIGLEAGLAERVSASGGAVFRLSDGTPDLRVVRENRQSHGPGWAGVVDRRAQATLAISRQDLWPAWLALLVISFVMIAAWLREGRR